MEAGAKAGAQTSKTALRIFCKSSSEYLGTLVAVAGDSAPGGPLGCSKNSDLGGGEEPEGATGERRATKRRSW